MVFIINQNIRGHNSLHIQTLWRTSSKTLDLKHQFLDSFSIRLILSDFHRWMIILAQ